MKYIFKIKEVRKVTIRVYKEGNIIYEGISDDAPYDIKELPMNKVEMDDKIINIWVDSEDTKND